MNYDQIDRELSVYMQTVGLCHHVRNAIYESYKPYYYVPRA